MLKENQDTGREMSDDEVVRLLSACRASVSRGLYTAVLLSIHTGLRSQELACFAGIRSICWKESSQSARARRLAAKAVWFICLRWRSRLFRTGEANSRMYSRAMPRFRVKATRCGEGKGLSAARWCLTRHFQTSLCRFLFDGMADSEEIGSRRMQMARFAAQCRFAHRRWWSN